MAVIEKEWIVPMVHIRWRNQFSPRTPQGAYEVLCDGKWQTASVEQIQHIVSNNKVLWNGEYDGKN